MRRITLVQAVALLLLLSGCVGRLQTSPYRERTDTLSGALRGVSYSLPKVQYDIKLTRWLAECPGDTVDGKPTALKFAVAVEGTPRFVPGEAYQIDYDRLAGLMRTSNFEIKYWPNGNLKSIGAGAEDKSGDVIKDATKTILAVASRASGMPSMALITKGPSPPPPPPPPESEDKGIVCTTVAFGKVRQARAAIQAIKTSTKELTRLTAEIERMKVRATLKLINKRADREGLLQLFTSVDAENKNIADATELLTELKAELGVADGFVWDSSLDKSEANQIRAYSLTDKQKTKLAGLLEVGTVAPLEGEADQERRRIFAPCFSSNKNLCIERQLNLRAAADVQAPLLACTPKDPPDAECLRKTTNASPRHRAARDKVADSGIFVREPVQARLLFCRVAYGDCTPARNEAELPVGSFPQLGQLRYLPLTVGPFQAREMTLSLTEQGQVETFSYKSTKAPAQAFASTAADVATQIDAALEKRETELRDDIKYAREQETADTQRQITLLTKELELKKLQEQAAGDPPDPLETLNDETAALEAQIANLKARKAILDAQAALAAPGV